MSVKVPGDVNASGSCTGADSLLINQVLVGLRNPATVADFANGDMNNSGTVTGADSLIINQFLVGLRKAPQDLALTVVPSGLSLTFSASIATMLLLRSTNGGAIWENYAWINPGTTQYTDSNVTPNTEHHYRMALPSQFSNVVSGTTADATLNTPTNPAVGTPTPNSLTITWGDANTSPNESGTEVYRATAAGGPFTLVHTAAANATSYVDTGLAANTTYFYKVRAV
jgi:hypothetical protein